MTPPSCTLFNAFSIFRLRCRHRPLHFPWQANLGRGWHELDGMSLHGGHIQFGRLFWPSFCPARHRPQQWDAEEQKECSVQECRPEYAFFFSQHASWPLHLITFVHPALQAALLPVAEPATMHKPVNPTLSQQEACRAINIPVHAYSHGVPDLLRNVLLRSNQHAGSCTGPWLRKLASENVRHIIHKACTHKPVHAQAHGFPGDVEPPRSFFQPLEQLLQAADEQQPFHPITLEQAAGQQVTHGPALRYCIPGISLNSVPSTTVPDTPVHSSWGNTEGALGRHNHPGSMLLLMHVACMTGYGCCCSPVL